MIYEVKVPQIDVNEEFVMMVEWFVQDEEYIERESTLCLIETTKTIFEIMAEKSGFVLRLFSEGDRIAILSVICVIADNIHELKNYKLKNSTKVVEFQNIMVTKKASDLAKKLGIDIEEIKKKGVIREKDIEELYKVENAENYKQKTGDIEIINNYEIIRSSRDVDRILTLYGRKIIIIGAGGHAKTCIDIIRQIGVFDIAGVVDPVFDIGTDFFGVKVIARDKGLEKIYEGGIKLAVIGVAFLKNPNERDILYQKIKGIGFYLPNIIHPKASIEPSVQMGEGNQIMAHATVGSVVIIGNNCIINSGSIISHDSKLGNNVHVAPGAILAVNVYVGSNTLIGMGVTVYMSVNIGENVLIYNGINVFKDVPNETILKNHYPAAGLRGI